jgi:DNA mismatch repair protein MutS
MTSTIKERLSDFILGKEQAECLRKITNEDSASSPQDINILKTIIQKNLDIPYIVDSNVNNVLYDLEMFESYDNLESSTVFYIIDKTKLAGSSIYLRNILSTPTNDVSILKERQLILQTLVNKHDNQWIENQFDTLKQNENILEWLYSMTDDDMQNLYNMVFFNTFFTKQFNKHSYALYGTNLYRILVSPTIGIISPIAYFMIPYLILRIKLKIKMSFISYIKTLFKSVFAVGSMMPSRLRIVNSISYAASLFFYFQGILNSIEISNATVSISKFLTSKMNKAIVFIQTMENVVEELWDHRISEYYFNDQNELNEPLRYDEFKHIDGEKEYSVFNNFGEKLKSYKVLNICKYETNLKRLYMLDSIYAIYRMHKDLDFSFSKYFTKRTKPFISLKNVWHPSIESPIKNNVDIQNIIITGPNAGGKSTIIKSILLSVLLSQTVCLSNSEYIRLTPFQYINSQMNVPDCKGKESLFEAEMKRSKGNLDKLKELDGSGFSLMIMDEIFNSTNPIEGISGAYAIMKSISSYMTNLMIFTTHYVYLTKLSSECNFKNMKMSVNICEDEDGVKDIKFPFILSEGVCRQYIALDLLKINGFDPDLVDTAISIKSKFV